MCEKTGPQLGVNDELFYRQVTKDWLEDGVPTSQAFHPWREIDAGCLSVDRHSRTTPAGAFKLFTDPKPTGFGGSSHGVWSLSREEIEGCMLSAWEDLLA
ncbi:MAG TPA: hypothetical protein VNG73_10120, partial [Gemmatimonadaceae bacterium]|nr:hypothetical protein [Gemmatimonadaceae bacterium]